MSIMDNKTVCVTFKRHTNSFAAAAFMTLQWRCTVLSKKIFSTIQIMKK